MFMIGKILKHLRRSRCRQPHIVFKCDACKNEQEFDIDNAWADVISCDCPEKIDKDGNAREYSAIEVTYDQEETTK